MNVLEHRLEREEAKRKYLRGLVGLRLKVHTRFMELSGYELDSDEALNRVFCNVDLDRYEDAYDFESNFKWLDRENGDRVLVSKALYDNISRVDVYKRSDEDVAKEAIGSNVYIALDRKY